MIIRGNALAIPLKDKSVQCCVSSPPYWGLRDYGTAKWEGGDMGCDHRQGRPGAGRADGIVDERSQRNRDGVGSMGGDCAKCGAVRVDNQLGIESTPEAYVDKMVDVFSEVWRVLKDDGTCWLNLGDSYATGGGAIGRSPGGGEQGERFLRMGHINTQPNRMKLEGLKSKDLVGIPWRVAFALQAAGWYLRSDIIWAKSNPMPESVTDRPTKSHEYLFLLAKNERYYYDAAAIKEQSITNDPRRPYTSQGAWEMDGRPEEQRHGGEIRLGREGVNSRIHQDRDPQHSSARKVRSPAGWKTGPGSHGSIHTEGREQEVTYVEDTFTKRNIRSVWTVSTQSFPEAHFATFPEALIKPCILAGCPSGGIVFDPFVGSGTTVKVAQDLGRRGVGLDLSTDYLRMAQRRTAQQGLIF